MEEEDENYRGGEGRPASQRSKRALNPSSTGRASGIRNFKTMIAISGVSEIYRRYFVMNMFDGVLAGLGVIIGMWMSGFEDPKAIVRTVLAAGLAMFFSGSLGAYLTEKAERERKIRELEGSLFEKVDGSIFKKSSVLAVLLVTVVDGVSPLFACLVLVSPFLLMQGWGVSFTLMSSISAGLGMATLSVLGILLGRIARGKFLEYSLLMVLAGLLSARASVMLGASI